MKSSLGNISKKRMNDCQQPHNILHKLINMRLFVERILYILIISPYELTIYLWIQAADMCRIDKVVVKVHVHVNLICKSSIKKNIQEKNIF